MSIKTLFNSISFFCEKLDKDIESFIRKALEQNGGQIKFEPKGKISSQDDLMDHYPVITTLNGDYNNFNVAIDKVYSGKEGNIYADGIDYQDGSRRERFLINRTQYHDILIFIGCTLGIMYGNFQKGQLIYWLDPEGISSGLYNIKEDISKTSGGNPAPYDIILIGNGVSEAEVHRNELFTLSEDMIKLLCPGRCRIEVTTMLGAASDRFVETGKAPSEKWAGKHGGGVHKVYFDTEGEFKAYTRGLSDMSGYDGWAVLPKNVVGDGQPDCPFCEHWRGFFSDREKKVFCPDCGKKIID